MHQSLIDCYLTNYIPGSETRLNQLMQTLTTHLNAIEKHEKHLDRLVLVSNDKDHELLDMDYSATVFAQELTRIELEHLCFLGPEELVHAFAKDVRSSSQSLPTDEIEAEAQVQWDQLLVCIYNAFHDSI